MRTAHFSYMLKLPYSALLFTGIIFLFMSLFKSESTLDIHLHDTYYVISRQSIYRFFAAVYILYWLLYFCTIRLLHSKMLTWIHVILTLLFAILLAITPFWLNEPQRPVGDNYINAADQFNRERIIAIILLIITFGQLVYVGNLITGVVKKIFSSTN